MNVRMPVAGFLLLFVSMETAARAQGYKAPPACFLSVSVRAGNGVEVDFDADPCACDQARIASLLAELLRAEGKDASCSWNDSGNGKTCRSAVLTVDAAGLNFRSLHFCGKSGLFAVRSARPLSPAVRKAYADALAAYVEKLNITVNYFEAVQYTYKGAFCQQDGDLSFFYVEMEPVTKT